MKKAVLGIDIGTSSVKLLLAGSGEPLETSAHYQGAGMEGIMRALRRALCKLQTLFPLDAVGAVGLSGQTGSYALVDEDGAYRGWISWRDAGRAPFLQRTLAIVPQGEWIRATGMAHPPLESYPAPTILYLRARDEALFDECLFLQPKDELCRLLTGEAVSDVGSWRGLVHPGGAYDEALLHALGARRENLPRIAEKLRIGENDFGLPVGASLFVGRNDFYAALEGMDVGVPGCCFDVTGTSEHFGVTTRERADSRLICSPYRGGYVNYGVTGSSGATLSWAQARFGAGEPPIPRHAPILLPYLKGERAPVFDADARGVLLGITSRTSADEMRYAAYEGVAFSLYNIWEALGSPPVTSIRATGGAAQSALLCRMKAALFAAPLFADARTCGSAVGAARFAGAVLSAEVRTYEPDGELGAFLAKRYEIYKKLYGAWTSATRGAEIKEIFGGE